jgi:hypothetical protein
MKGSHRPGAVRQWLVCITSFVLLASKSASAESAKKPTDGKAVTVTTNLLAPLFRAYYLDANLRASQKLGVLLNASYFSIENGVWSTRSGTLGAGFSYYFQGDALRRWYVEASSEFMLSRWRHDPSGSTAPLVPGFTLGSVVGYRFVWELGPVLDLAAGAVLLHFPSARAETETGPVSSDAFTRLYPAIKANVGWAF